MIRVLNNHFGNPASKTNSFGWYAEELVKIAREQVAALISAAPEEIIFTSGATEAINTAIFGLARGLKRKYPPKDFHILSAVTEHKATLDCLAALSEEGYPFALVSVDSFGTLHTETFHSAIQENTRLVTLMHANNEIGVIHDIAALTALAKAQKCVVHCDAAQSLGKVPLDIKALGVDLASFSGHKIYGPKGVGVLYIRGGAKRQSVAPLIYGGGHEQGLRSGTLNVPGIVGMGKACELLKQEFSVNISQITRLTASLFQGLRQEIPGIELNGHDLQRLPGNLNLFIPGVDSSALIGELSSKVAFSTTSACTSGSKTGSYVLNALKLPGNRGKSSIRLGIGKFNTEDDIHQAIHFFAEAVKKLTPSIDS